MRLARTASPLPRNLASRSRTCDLRRPKPAGWPHSPTARRSNDEVGGGPCVPQTGRRVAMNASRCHPLLVGTPASHRRGPPGRCPLPLATPDARYGPRTAKASAVVPSLPWTARRQSNAQSTPGGTRTRSFRIESPASFPFRPQGRTNSARARGQTSDRGRPPCRCRLRRRRPHKAENRIDTPDRSHHGSAKPSRTSIGLAPAAGIEPAPRD